MNLCTLFDQTPKPRVGRASMAQVIVSLSLSNVYICPSHASTDNHSMHSAYNSSRHRCMNSSPSYPTLSTSWTACTIPDRMRARCGAVDDARRASRELDVAVTLRESARWCAGRHMIAMAWWRESSFIWWRVVCLEARLSLCFYARRNLQIFGGCLNFLCLRQVVS